MRRDYRLFLASMTVGLAVLLVGVQAQSANKMFFTGNWNGTFSIGLPSMEADPYGMPYAYHISTGTYASYSTPAIWRSTPTSCFFLGYYASPPPLWGAGNIAHATTTTPTGFLSRPGCDVRGPGFRPATKNNPVAPNPVAGYFAQFPPYYTGWGYGLAGVTTAGSAPRAFTIPSNLFRQTDLYIQSPPTGGYVQWSLYGKQYNGAGNFGPGLSMGSGTWTINPTTTGGGGTGHSFAGKLMNKAGANQFGGTMQFLGLFNEIAVALTAGSVAYNFWHRRSVDMYACVGAGVADKCVTTITSIYKTGTFPSPLNTTVTVFDSMSIIGFPWGTGTLTLTQRGLAGTSPWIMTTKGYDNRNSAGTGAIKMVTAYFAGSNQFAWSNESELVLNFVPEPRRDVMLAAGVLLLVGLVQLRLRRR